MTNRELTQYLDTHPELFINEERDRHSINTLVVAATKTLRERRVCADLYIENLIKGKDTDK